MANSRDNYSRTPDGYLNIALVDSTGKDHRFNKGIPLFESNKLGRSILNAQKAHEVDHQLWIEGGSKGKEPIFQVNLMTTSVVITDAEGNAEDIAI